MSFIGNFTFFLINVLYEPYCLASLMDILFLHGDDADPDEPVGPQGHVPQRPRDGVVAVYSGDILDRFRLF